MLQIAIEFSLFDGHISSDLSQVKQLCVLLVTLYFENDPKMISLIFEGLLQHNAYRNQHDY